MSITWKADVYVTQDGRIIELPRNLSISEMEELEEMDRRNGYSFATGMAFAVLFSSPFWLLAIALWRNYR